MTEPTADRMTQNATALVASSMITAVLGLLFWVVAARVLPTVDVGTGTAIVTSIVLLGNLATLGLRNGLIRFMAAAGSDAGRFILTAYVLCATVAIAVAAGFAFGTPWWADELTALRDDRWAGIAFAAGTATWTVFVLQDNVLTGLRRAVWVPVENLAYSVLKIGFLVALVGVGAWALPLAWCVPALLMIVPVNLLIFRRLLPAEPARPTTAIFTRAAIARFSIGDFGSDLVRMLGVEVVVLVVLGMRGAEDTAYVFFAITIAATGQLVTNNIVTAFVAEASARPADGDGLARRAAINIARLIVPGAVVGALLAPVVLGTLGGEYAANGTALLQLLVLDAIPLAVATIAIGWARFRRSVRLMLAISLSAASAPLLGAVALAPTFGLAAIGWAALVGHTALAIVLLATTLRPVWSGGEGGGVLGWLVIRRRDIRHRRRAQVVATVLDELDATRLDQPSLEPRWLVPSDNDTAIVKIEHPTAPRIAKIALSGDAADGLRRHAAALAELSPLADGTPVASVLPTVVAEVECAGHHVVIETACDGRTPLAADHGTLVAIASTVTAVHRLSARSAVIDEQALHRLVHEPINVLTADRRLWPLLGEMNGLSELLERALRGRRLVLARTHGDCWSGNALVETGDGTIRVTGLVDWEDSVPDGLPDVDLAHLWLAAEDRHIGRTAVDVVLGDRSAPIFADLAALSFNPGLHADVLVLLAWLQHVAAGLRRASRFGLGRVWLANNVEPVLRAVPAIDPSRWNDGRPAPPAVPTSRMVTDAR